MDGIPLVNDGLIYDFIQILREGTTSTYDNLLINYVSSVNAYSGNYACAVKNNFGNSSRQTTFYGILSTRCTLQPAHMIAHAGIRVSQHSVLILGSAVNITCSSDLGVSSIEWVKDGQVQTFSQGSNAVLTISSVRDSDYQSEYTCRSRASFGIQEHTIVLQTEGIQQHTTHLQGKCGIIMAIDSNLNSGSCECINCENQCNAHRS